MLCPTCIFVDVDVECLQDAKTVFRKVFHGLDTRETKFTGLSLVDYLEVDIC